jgi:predicted transcriptional regulator
MNDEANDPVTDGGAEAVEKIGNTRFDLNGVRNNGHDDSSRDETREFLLETVRRKSLLDVLRSGAASATELSDSVDMSRSTVHRATNTLEERRLIERSNGRYRLTGLGRIVTEKTDDFGEEVWTAVTLEPFLNTIDTHGIPIEHFCDARISHPTPRQPHTTIQRIVDLVESSDSLRMLSTVLSPIYVNVGYREMMDGMDIEAVFDREAIEIMVSQYAEEAYKAIQSGNFDVYAHEGLPFELFLLDNKIGMAAHDGNGIAQVLVECEDTAAIEWAETVFDEHRNEAEPLMLSRL